MLSGAAGLDEIERSEVIASACEQVRGSDFALDVTVAMGLTGAGSRTNANFLHAARGSGLKATCLLLPWHKHQANWYDLNGISEKRVLVNTEEAEVELYLRKYQWALTDLTREIKEGCPFLRTLSDPRCSEVSHIHAVVLDN